MAIRIRNLIAAALIAIASPAFAQSPSDLPIPPFTTWDPTNALGTLNNWVVNDLNPNLTTSVSGATTTYPTHAILTSTATVPISGPATLSQQGFYASGDGGAATYVWNPASYCPGGTSLLPTTADGIVCILPSGQSASIAGRYILQVGSSLSVLQIGMVPGNQDNAPFVSALMNAVSVAINRDAGGYDVYFPASYGQIWTSYYFSAPLTLTRGMYLHCGGGPTDYNSVALIFAAGSKGVIQENYQVSSDGGAGNGTVEGCLITSQGQVFASSGGVAGANQIINTAFETGDLNGLIPISTWSIGDGVMAAPFGNSSSPVTINPVIPPGTSVSNVSGSTITLSGSSTINAQFGSAQAKFTESGQLNFVINDSITVGNSTYTFVAAPTNPGDVALGKDVHASNMGAAAFLVSIQNLANCINLNTTTSTCIAQLTTPNITAITPSQRFAGITFWAATGGTAGNSLTSTYTAAGISAGSFGHATFTGGLAAASMILWQLPVNQAYTVQTSIGSKTVTVTAGPRPLEPGDIIWSDAFPMWTTVQSIDGQTFPQSVLMDQPFLNATGQNASVNHTGDAPGKLWVVPVGLEREITAATRNLSFQLWPIAFQMPCGSHTSPSFNCTQSHDDGNIYLNNGFGRYQTGSNYSGSGSKDEFGAKNYFSDLADLGALGMTFTNFTAHSGESGTSYASIIDNCTNLNGSIYIGGYEGQSSLNAGQCAAVVGLYPTTTGGAFNIGPQQGGWDGGGSIIHNGGTTGLFEGGVWQFLGGANFQDCVQMSGAPTLWYTFGFSHSICSTGTTWGTGWDNASSSWYLNHNVSELVLRYAAVNNGYTGYAGPAGTGVIIPYGVVMDNLEDAVSNVNDARSFSMGTVKPTNSAHLGGDTQANTAAVPGSNGFWVDTPSFTTTLSEALLSGLTGTFTATIGPSSTTMAVTAFTSGSICVGGAVAGAGVTANTKVTTLESGATHGCDTNTGNYTVSISQTEGTPETMTSTGQTVVSVAACPAVVLAAGTPVDDTTATPPYLLGTLTTCTSTTLTLQAAAGNAGGSGDTIKFMIWAPEGIVQDTIPAISACGTGTPTVTAGSTNLAGQFTLGTGTPTACTITFAHAYPAHSFCTVTPASSGGAAIAGGDYLSANDKTGFTWTLGTGTSSLVFNYTCAGN